MDINALNTIDLSERGVEFEIIDPRKGKGTGAFLTSLGPDSQMYKAVTKELVKQSGEATFAEILSHDGLSESMACERTIRCITGWRGWTKEGKPLAFSEAELRKVFAASAVVRKQAIQKNKDESNFLPPASAS